MYIHENTVNALNTLLAACFQMNSFADNIAYSLDIDLNCPVATKVYHESYAHLFPQLADEITEFMSNLSVRPVRLGLTENTDIYSNIEDLFKDNLDAIHNFRATVIETIGIAEQAGDREAVMFLEDFWDDEIVLLKQCQIWYNKALEYANDTVSFDKDFPRFTIL